jgi:hypothetical protein
VLIDGVGSADLADSLVDGLTTAGRPPVRVSAGDYLRPAGERLEWGREDPEAVRHHWLDADALVREVLRHPSSVLPALWDARRDRSARADRVDVPPHGVVLVDGLLLLGRGLPADVVVHVSLSCAALRRRGVPEWQLPAFAQYDDEVVPREACDVLVLAEDPRRPAVVVRAPDRG